MTEVTLQEPWATAERQRVAVQFGMWLFLATETLFFGGLFLTYAVARFSHPAGFVAAAREAEAMFGTINTVVLLTSSLTMAIAERAVREALVPLARAMFAATLMLGVAFLVVKGFEYRSDIVKHLVPGPEFTLSQTGASQFWAFYWTATGVHACHMLIGLGVVTRMLLIPAADLPGRSTTAEGSALYWHLVDLIWVILYALIYLVGR
ncbi:cytochrome c oxidase subunit 3 [Sphingomonas gellani]|uniref:Cytochrome c oxidase subunit 3 n=1 Tax=Sphingomonas gellani TaxID=1166340 RepID=A0A1H7ZHW8_9SPHN|nr:cytochrome c oxidase subunit 3 [Sphingomonas gellani]SEM57138.1 cytochrome c oxidase subunit 3 [Sphingomonas gellani]